MFEELTRTYSDRENEVFYEKEGLRSKQAEVLRKNRRLIHAYRSLRYQLEDLAPPGVELDVLGEDELQKEEEMSDLERQQEAEITKLVNKVATLEKELMGRQEFAFKETETYERIVAETQKKMLSMGEELVKLHNLTKVKPCSFALITTLCLLSFFFLLFFCPSSFLSFVRPFFRTFFVFFSLSLALFLSFFLLLFNPCFFFFFLSLFLL